MGIGSYHVYDNTTDYRDYWESAVSPPTKNATNVEEFGCYIIKIDESEKIWITYTTYYTYHYLCKNHMREYRYREHNLSKKKD